jgi:hypothetical protein
MADFDLKTYLSDVVARHFVNELRPILGIKGVTENSKLLGDYTEAAVRNLAIRVAAHANMHRRFIRFIIKVRRPHIKRRSRIHYLKGEHSTRFW